MVSSLVSEMEEAPPVTRWGFSVSDSEPFARYARLPERDIIVHVGLLL